MTQSTNTESPQISFQQTSLAQILPGLKKAQLRVVFSYLFHLIKVDEFRASFVGTQGLHIKRKIDSSGYILRDCKLYAWAYHRAIRCGDPIPKFRDYGVTKEDAAFLRTLNLVTVPKKYEAYTQKRMEETLAFITDTDMESYISKFAYRKHKFLVDIFGYSFEDITQRLRGAALYAAYRQYPFFNPKTPGHVIAVAKIAVRNSGQNLIQENTTQSRQRLNTDNKSMYETFGDAATVENHPELSALNETDTFMNESMQALAKLEHKMTPRAKRFLLIMSGQHDEEFSSYLGRDNSTAAERMEFEQYSKKVRKFFSTSGRSVEKFFNKIRQRAGWQH